MAIRKQSWAQRNMGKVLLAGSIVIVVIYSVAVVAGQGDSKGAVTDVAKISAALNKRISDRSQDETPALPDVEKAVGGWKLEIPARDDLPMWTFNREPKIKVTVKKPVDTRPDLFGPVDLTVSVSEDFKVEIKWSADTRTTAPIEGYDVFRWKKGEEKPTKPVTERLIKGTVFVDEDYDAITPMGSLVYAVRAHTKQDVKQGVKIAESAPLEVTIPDDRAVAYYGGGTVQMAVLHVKRFCKGDWAEEKFTVYLGDPVGNEKLVTLPEEMTVVEETTEEHKRGSKGELLYDEDGNPIMVKKVTKMDVMREFVVLVDGKGEPEKIWKTKKPDTGPPPPPPADAPYFRHYMHDLRTRQDKAPGPLKKILRMRVKYLSRAEKKLIDTPGNVDENLLSEEGKLLYELRWEWLKAKDKEAQFPRNKAFKKKAEELTWRIKDLERFLSPKGWDREKEEWERDREEAQGHKDFKFPPALWPMTDRPEKAQNTKGGKPPGKKPAKKKD
ncbi:MAG: hypothetical protein ACYTFG_22730 [Planctomycetota bacterium]|jgi:hypothetical protein